MGYTGNHKGLTSQKWGLREQARGYLFSLLFRVSINPLKY